MKAIKIIVGVLILLAIIVGGVVFYGLGNLNTLVKEVVEHTGSELTQTRVSVGNVDIKLLEGTGAIYNLAIANPKGYSNNSLFSANSVVLKIDVESLRKSVKVINNISVGEIALLAEQKNIKDTNIQALLDNIQASSGEDKPSTEKQESGPDIRIMIEKINFADSKIDLQTEKLGSKQINLPGFTLNSIGNKTTGVTPEQAGQEITRQLMTKVKAAIKQELNRLIKDEAKDKLKEKLKDKLKDGLSKDKLKSLFK